MRNPILAVLAGIAASAAGPLQAAASPEVLKAALAKVDEAARTFHSLTADIRKTSYTAVLNESLTDEGAIRVRRPKPRDMRVLVSFTKPDVKSVAIAGKTVEIFMPKINTVQIYDADKKQKVLMDQFLLLGFGTAAADLAANYSISAGGQETIAGQKTTRLELIPKSKEVLVHLKKVELWISESNGLAVQQKLHMPGGDFSLATYSNMKVNPALSDAQLKLNLPEGVKREYPQK